MSQLLLYEAMARERSRDREKRNRSEYVRRLAVLRRRQRKADAARRSLARLTVR